MSHTPIISEKFRYTSDYKRVDLPTLKKIVNLLNLKW